MKTRKNKTVDTTRKIRTEHAKRLVGKSCIAVAFYREHAKQMEKKIPVLLSELAIVEGGRWDYSNDRHARQDNQSNQSGASVNRIATNWLFLFLPGSNRRRTAQWWHYCRGGGGNQRTVS